MGFEKVKAASVSDIIFQKEGVLTKSATNKIIEGGGDGGFFAKWNEIGGTLQTTIGWFKDLPENIPQYSIDLLAKVYELLSNTVLYTPLFLFNNSIIKNTSLVFSGVSIMVVIILYMIEGIKRMLKKKKGLSENDIFDSNILKRFGIAVTGAGFAPFLFEKTFQLLNMLSKAIAQIGSSQISNFDMMPNNLLWMITGLGSVDTILLLVFDVLVIYLLIPVVFQVGRRWFDLLCLSSLTPLALTAWVFDDYRHYFNKWWSSVKRLGQSQLVYAIYICLMGVFIFGTANVVTGWAIVTKILVIIGALFRMANPPEFVKSRTDQDIDTFQMGKNAINSGKRVFDTVTLKPTRLIMNKKNAEKAKATKALRKKHGQRFVKGLQ
jgi:hypothetical protein